MSQVNLLTPEEEVLIPQYQKKWRYIGISTQPIDKQKAEAAVNSVYTLMGKKAPKIVFCRSPYEALQLKHKPDKLLETTSSSNITNINRPNFQSQFWLLVFLQVLVQVIWSILSFIGLALWKKLKPKNPLQKLELQLNRSTLKQLSKKIDEITPQEIKVQDIVTQSFKNSADLFNDSISQVNDPQQQEIMQEVIDQFSNQSSEAGATSFSTTNSGEEQQLSWLPQKNKLLRFWFKKFYLGTWSTKIAGVNSSLLENHILSDLQQKIPQTIQKYPPLFKPQSAISKSILFDFVDSVLDFSFDVQKLAAFYSLVRECGWIFLFDKTCYICDRPSHISRDERNFYHGEGEMAISYSDGYGIYAHHGVILPEKYGSVHPHQWQAKWLLEEKNAELRRVLIQGIGYGRLCAELAATELDSWREYTLLKIDNSIDVEPIHLLKMLCPSTGYIHATRVPPNIQSAREAISWVNWDIDPEDFSVET
ncbi:MAG: DUF6745 domain-containing protein [Xenococcus sp. (in: cyanobacteria)]